MPTSRQIQKYMTWLYIDIVPRCRHLWSYIGTMSIYDHVIY